MDRAHLPEEAAAEESQDAIGLQEHPPEAVHSIRLIGRMHAVFGEPDRVRDFTWRLAEGHIDADTLQEPDCPFVEVRDRLRHERERSFAALAASRGQSMADEVELQLDDLITHRDRRGAQSARGHIERKPASCGSARASAPAGLSPRSGSRAAA